MVNISKETGYRWYNICLGIKISINSGAALLLYLPCFYLLWWWAGTSARLASIYPVAVGALTGAFGGFLVKRYSDKKVGFNAELEKLKVESTNGGKHE